MQLIFRLPFVLLETALRQGATGLAALVRLLRSDADGARVTAAPGSATPPQGRQPRPPSPTAEEALRRRAQRDAAAAPPAPGPAPRAASGRAPRASTAPAPAPPAPTPPPPAAERAHVDREATVVESFGPADDPHGALTVDTPWEGYDRMPATAIVQRLRGADEATRAVVRLYEQRHKNRQTVLRATG